VEKPSSVEEAEETLRDLHALQISVVPEVTS
jgi:hypothetical protein